MGAIPSRWVVTETPISNAADVLPALAGRKMESTKTPHFSTGVKSLASGREVRTSFWSSPKWSFNLSYEFIRNRVTQPELSKLWGFFATQLGKFGAWFYQDPYDNTVTGGTLGVGNGTATDFQATRTLAAATGYAFNEAVYAFYLQPTIYINGTPTVAFTVQPWGVIRFNTAPTAGAALTWSGGFLFVCRFEQDDLATEQMFFDLFSAKGLNFVSLKP